MVPHHKFPIRYALKKIKKKKWLYTYTIYLLVKQNVLNYIKKTFNTRDVDHIARKKVKKKKR